MKRYILSLFILLLTSFLAQAEQYLIDTEKAHAFIDFRIQHLGYSWISGRFNNFTGNFSYDENNPNQSKVEVDIDIASIDTNHAERDKHLRSNKYFNVDSYPKASFRSTLFEQNQDGTALLTGNLSLHGVTKQLKINVKQVGHGPDPWSNHRRGFIGTTQFTISDYGINVTNLGPSSQVVFMTLSVEGIRLQSVFPPLLH